MSLIKPTASNPFSYDIIRLPKGSTKYKRLADFAAALFSSLNCFKTEFIAAVSP